MAGTALVSIVIPTRNRARLLAETLASVQAQTFPRWRALVVDDGSTDDTRQLVGALAQQDPRIVWLPRSGPTAGAPACRNLGLRHAGGEYVIFLDSDDLLAPRALESRVQLMTSAPSLDFAVFPCELFTTRPGDTGLLWNVASDEPDLDRLLRLDVPWQTTGPIWRLRALHRLGGWDESLPSWQDWELHVRALCLGMHYRRHPQQVNADCYWRQPGAESIGRQSVSESIGRRSVSEGIGGRSVSESIGRRSVSESHLRSHHRLLGDVAVLLRRCGRWNDRRRRLLAGLHYWLATTWAERGHGDEALRVWHSCADRGLLGEERVLRQGAAMFRLWSIESLRHRCQEIQLRSWPKGVRFEASRTFRQVAVPGQIPAAT